MSYRPSKIISGGQTGVDRGALDAAEVLGIDRGGWCPRGRRAEDGVVPVGYPVEELDTERYEDRTERNVRSSDATLILSWGRLSGGTAYTAAMARKYEKPLLVVDPDMPDAMQRAHTWLERVMPVVLDVAGPRESEDAGIGMRTKEWLVTLFSC